MNILDYLQSLATEPPTEVDPEEATTEDYESALQQLGVIDDVEDV